MTSGTLGDPVAKALWFIESHFSDEISLDAIAAAAGVSRYHLSRAFTAVTGMPVIRYVRGRRLTEAAFRLANGAPDILAVALDAGYGSHEAFTRAFSEQFGHTPEAVRRSRALDEIPLVAAKGNDPPMNAALKTPRMEDGRLLLIAGIARRYSPATIAAIPSQWQQFVPYIGNIAGQTSSVTYGVCMNADEKGTMEYLSGVEVSSFDGIPEDFATARIPARRYAVFAHEGHVSTIRATWEAIFRSGLPAIGSEMADAPDFERYDERFDGRTGRGLVEIWIPLAEVETRNR
jgi:AraC family transcriptional regulator